MKIYLHIGTEKTGTTSIQNFLAENRDRLLKKKILYPKSLGSPNNINLAIAFQSEEKQDDLRIRSNILTPKDIKKFQARIYKNLKDEIEAVSPEILLISSEHLSSRLNKDKEIQKLYQFLSSFAEEIEVLIYLRRQDGFYESLYSTAIKSGHIFEFSVPTIGSERDDFHYDTMLSKWEEVFKQENIIVRLFSKKYLHNADVVEDFLNILQIPVKYRKNDIKNINRSLGRKKLAYLKMLNKFLPVLIKNKVNHLRGNIVEILENLDIKDTPIRLSNISRLEFLSRFEQGNQMVAKRYFKNRDQLFDEAFETKDFDARLTVSAKKVMKITSKIWERKQQAYMGLRNENLYLKCDLLLEKGRIVEAEKKISEYHSNYPKHPRGDYLKARLLYIRNKDRKNIN